MTKSGRKKNTLPFGVKSEDIFERHKLAVSFLLHCALYGDIPKQRAIIVAISSPIFFGQLTVASSHFYIHNRNKRERLSHCAKEGTIDSSKKDLPNFQNIINIPTKIPIEALPPTLCPFGQSPASVPTRRQTGMIHIFQCAL